MNKKLLTLLITLSCSASVVYAKNTITTINDTVKWARINIHFDAAQSSTDDCHTHRAWIPPGGADHKEMPQSCRPRKLVWGVADTKHSHIRQQDTLHLPSVDGHVNPFKTFTLACGNPECTRYVAR